jgi:hypothetical protein
MRRYKYFIPTWVCAYIFVLRNYLLWLRYFTSLTSLCIFSFYWSNENEVTKMMQSLWKCASALLVKYRLRLLGMVAPAYNTITAKHNQLFAIEFTTAACVGFAPFLWQRFKILWLYANYSNSHCKILNTILLSWG